MNLSQKIELWPMDRLIPYARHARTHSADQVAQVAASIREFGFTNPILVDTQAGILAGHARLLAARKLNLSQVPVIVLDHLSATQKRAYILVDNRLALNAGWDEEMLATELAALQEESFQLDLLGFDEEEVEKALASLEEPFGGDEDAVPEPPLVPISATGDLWLLGRHRVLCGDALSPESIEQLLAGGHADMVFTDPPYNVDYSPTSKAGRARRIANDNLGEGFGAFLFQACSNILACTRGAVYICMSSSELHTLQKAFLEAGGHWSTFLIWAKNRFTLGRSDYQRQFEPMLYGWKEGEKHYWCGARDQGDLWSIDKPFCNDLHPTMKPVELIVRAIENSSRRGAIVLDPFGGSGSSLIACEKTDRQAALLEVDPRYVDVMVQRWQDFSGEAAVLEADGRTFAQIAQERAGVAVLAEE